MSLHFIHHIVLVVSDIKQTAEFYRKVLGKPEEKGRYSIMYHIGKTKLFLTLPYGKLSKKDRFDPNRIGLEHLAFGVNSLGELKKIEKHLDEQEIRHSGIHIDKHSRKEKIWLDDPDGIRMEFYL